MNLLFDLDGTLTNPYQGIAKSICHALKTLGRPVHHQTDLRWCIGPPLKNSFAKLLKTDDENLIQAAISIYRERFGTVGLFENEIYKDIPEALVTLRDAGHILYVATSKPTIFAERIIEHFGLGQYFRAVHGSELNGTNSDKADLLAHLLQSEGIAPAETIMIGDRRHDMIGAKSNGIFRIGVLWGYGTRDELEASGAQACIRHPEALQTAFDK
ncbi:hydrolase [Desulfosarcina widdelii]|uniref:Hydrolase n=1 Tax=Desulfosarcina widdelii TaxID=947919 RepID=A0A5K7YY80_9BACT|nr:HAD family hydrolase [Desulfosarcina widdelii]BBO73375.1 hydrolase [Desulfosarcina widdelii]